MSKNNRKWLTSVNELVGIFYDSLRALIPHLERAHMHWDTYDAYDDWDEISQTLYRNIVVRSIEYSLSDDEKATFIFPQYDTLYTEYSTVSFIEVVDKVSRPDTYLLFHSFTTNNNVLDCVQCILINKQGKVLQSDFETFAFDEVQYQLQYRSGSDNLKIIQGLNVVL